MFTVLSSRLSAGTRHASWLRADGCKPIALLLARRLRLQGHTDATFARWCGDARRKGQHMHRHTRLATALLGLCLLFSGAWPAAGADPKSAIDEIRKGLMQLPYS